jgi:hypothetical protein
MEFLIKNEKKAERAERTAWQRPMLRRLEASLAGGSGAQIDDGNCNGTGSIDLHVCHS